ncbi:MAG: 5-oxoprolinase subunit PxpA [Flavobacteriaceae bacterium]|nr:5-oxoprolinase subunit PxpA [Flavobacteriaceae bacterium]MDH3796268.1 5-oxoprolinase subunit PxpA [Flavobacteriaceae bacterium]
MDQKLRIDLNCDVGEGVGNETQLLPMISSCNIACGGHAGNESSIRTILRLAKTHKVKAGAHPSYPDRVNFGRISMKISGDALKLSIQEQLERFFTIAEEEGVSVFHIKPHGALYNDIARDESLAEVFLTASVDYLTERVLFAPFGSVIAQRAREAGITVWYEAFADRNYNKDLSLVSRKKEQALITDPEGMKEHVLRIVKEGLVETIAGDRLPIKAQTFCVHGDTPNAVSLLKQLIAALETELIRIDK